MTPWPKYTSEEMQAVSRVLKSGKVNYLFGNLGKKFEKEFASFVGTRYALALANGTLALDIALRAIDIRKGDEVIVTPRSYIASVSSVSLLGGIPKFVDIDFNSQNITAETIEPAITKKTKAIICVHLAGMPCEMDSIMKLAKKYQLKVIEDCAQAHGAKYKGKSVGSIGHLGTWSFCNDKIMTLGGEGGMITTNSKKYINFAKSFNNHGKNFNKIVRDQNKIPKFRYIHDSIGSNYRMTEMQSAIGRIQLKRLENWVNARRKNAALIFKSVAKIPLVNIPSTKPYMEHAFYKCYLTVNKNLLNKGWSRDRIILKINKLGVRCFSGSCPEIYLEKSYKMNRISRLPNSKKLGEESLMFEVHPSLTRKEMLQKLSVIKSVLTEASKR
jgi:dTDP-4-amino-4,6-dideoxygalactose transaminase